MKNNFVTLATLIKRAPGGGPTDVVAIQIDFVRAYDARHPLCPGGIFA